MVRGLSSPQDERTLDGGVSHRYSLGKPAAVRLPSEA